MMRFFATVCVAGSLVGACAELTGAPPKQDVSGPVTVTALGTDEILSRVGKLPAQTLGSNECGMFLWLRREDVPLVYFQRSDGQAYMAVDGAVRTLTRTEATDTVALQYYRKQRFDADGLTVSLSINPEETPSLQQGLRVPSGTISLEGAEGWAAALPVAGLIGCQ